MKTEFIGEHYEIIHPLPGPGLDPQMQYDAVITHGHFTIDVTGSIPQMVHAAVAAGIDTIWTSGHDTPKEYDLVKNVVSDYGYERDLGVQPAIEISARGPKKQLRHVMAYGVTDAPPPGLSPEEVNAWAHGEGPDVKTALAHPELLFFSVKSHELKKNQTRPQEEQYDFGEIANGGVMSIDAWRKKHPVLAKFAKRLPSEKDNERMGEIVIAEFRLPALGGDDFHHPMEIGNVINLVPHGKNIFDAANSGELLIAVRRNPVAPELWRMGVGTFKGAIKDQKVRHQWRRASQRNYIAAA